jgi:hypothetical protein
MAPKAHRALKAKATVAAKVATVMAVAPKSNVAIRVLTTVAKAKAGQHHGVHALKVVVQVAAHKAAATVAAKTADVTTATSCHATSIL